MNDILHIPDSYITKILESIHKEGEFRPTLFLRTKNRPDYLHVFSLVGISKSAIKRDIYIIELGNSVRNGTIYNGIEGFNNRENNMAKKSEDSGEFQSEEIELIVDEILEACLMVEAWKIKWSSPVSNEYDIIRSKEKKPDAVMASYKSHNKRIASKVYCVQKSSEGKILLTETVTKNYTTEWEPRRTMSLLFNPNL